MARTAASTRGPTGVLSPLAGGAVAAAGETRRPSPRLRAAIPAVALAIAVAAPLAVRGGFTGTSRSLFVGLALIALSLALAYDERPLAGVARSPAVLSLFGFAALAAASAAWTIGDPADAIRAGLVAAGLGCIALVSAWVTRAHGVLAVAILIAGLAVAEAMVGLVSAGLRVEPFAQRIGGSWRPGGTFEYPPALAVAQVSALPVLVAGMLRGGTRTSIAAAAAAGLAGAAIALADSRIAIALAVALAMVAIAGARRLGGPRPGRIALAAAVPAAAGLAAHLLVGGYAPAWAPGGDAARLAALLAVPAASAAAWAALRRVEAGAGRPAAGTKRIRFAMAAAGVVAAAGAAVAVAAPGGAEGIEPTSGVDHGRISQWGVAVDAGAERPLSGSGADTYVRAAASVSDQPPATLYAHSLPLEAWTELGAAGLALVVALYAAVAALAWRLRRTPGAWLVAPAALAFLLANLADWPWHLAGSAAIWALALGACLGLAADRRAREA